MQRKRQCTLAFASCNTSALAIATNTLAYGIPGNPFDIVPQTLFPNRMGFADLTSVIESAFEATQVLFELIEHTELAIGVMQETVSEKIAPRRGRVFTVGIVVACYRHGPISLFSAEDWVPADKSDEWTKVAGETLERLQYKEVVPPSNDILQAARVVGTSLVDHLVLEPVMSETMLQ